MQLQRAQLLRAIDLTEVEVRDQMMDQARNRKKVRTLHLTSHYKIEKLRLTRAVCVCLYVGWEAGLVGARPGCDCGAESPQAATGLPHTGEPCPRALATACTSNLVLVLIW